MTYKRVLQQHGMSRADGAACRRQVAVSVAVFQRQTGRRIFFKKDRAWAGRRALVKIADTRSGSPVLAWVVRADGHSSGAGRISISQVADA